MWPPPQFFELHNGLPREGPGDDAITRRAVELLPELPPDPVVVDAGCGPGGQTLVLARELGVRVTAIDLHEPFVEVLKRRAEAAGLDHLIEAREGNMSALPFEPGSVHLIWCEGALYQIGFHDGLVLWRSLLADGGIVAASDSDFVRAVGAFHEAGLDHISYICECIPEMDPELRDPCRELREEYSRALGLK